MTCIIYKYTCTQIYTGKQKQKQNKNHKQIEKLLYLHGKFNTCQLLFIGESKITSLLFCPNAVFFCFGSFSLSAPEHRDLICSWIFQEDKMCVVRLPVTLPLVISEPAGQFQQEVQNRGEIPQLLPLWTEMLRSDLIQRRFSCSREPLLYG